MKTVSILGIKIHNVTWEEVDNEICRLVDSGVPSFIVTPNVDHLVRLQTDQKFRDIYRKASLILADGMPLIWAGRFLNTPINEKISGSDLVPRLAGMAAQKGYRLFFLGGREGAATQAAKNLQREFPQLEICGCYSPPMGFEKDADETRKIIGMIQETAPHILLVGLGSPKQENWINEYYQTINVPVSIGIGVTFEFIAGMVKRAPGWMQKCGLEWFWRLSMEPRRLWRRYLNNCLLFFPLLIKQKYFSYPEKSR